MEKRTIQVDKQQKELCTHGTPGFPMTVNHDKLWTFEGNHIPCHWHEDLELVLVHQGSIQYQIHGEACVLTSGQGILINGNVPHSAVPIHNSQVVLLTIIIQPVFLYDCPGSDMEVNCLRPFLHNQNLSCLFLDPRESWMYSVINKLKEVDHYFSMKTFGFELKIKSLLCDCFFEILTRNQNQLKTYTPSCQEDLYRLRILLDYLHTHYDQRISLIELANEVHLTRETCCRFFRRMTGKTVSQYITEYRVGKSLMFLTSGQHSITQVAELCGFSNASRFAVAFHARMSMNPRDFLRKNNSDKGFS